MADAPIKATTNQSTECTGLRADITITPDIIILNANK